MRRKSSAFYQTDLRWVGKPGTRGRTSWVRDTFHQTATLTAWQQMLERKL